MTHRLQGVIVLLCCLDIIVLGVMREWWTVRGLLIYFIGGFLLLVVVGRVNRDD